MTLAEVWCRECAEPADGPDALCSAHRRIICSGCLQPITTIVEWVEVPTWGVLVTQPFHVGCRPPLIEEYADDTVRRHGPMIVGERCPWCGGLVTGPDHDRSHD